MNPDPFDYDLVIRYLDDSASEDDRRQARELLLSNPEARAYLLEVAGQMVHLKDQYSAYLNTAEEDLDTLPCQLPPQPSQLVEARKQPVGRHLKLMFNKVDRLRLFAGSLLE
jgi:anti-sigma factor RsiW